MKKDTRGLPDQTPTHETESKEPAVLAQPQEYVRKPRRTLPFKEIFSERTDVDTATLLTHACETLAALSYQGAGTQIGASELSQPFDARRCFA